MAFIKENDNHFQKLCFPRTMVVFFEKHQPRKEMVMFQYRGHNHEPCSPRNMVVFPMGMVFLGTNVQGYLQKKCCVPHHYKRIRFFLLGKLVKRHPKWPLSNLTKVSSWTSCFDMATLTKSFYWYFLMEFFTIFSTKQLKFDDNYI